MWEASRAAPGDVGIGQAKSRKPLQTTFPAAFNKKQEKVPTLLNLPQNRLKVEAMAKSDLRKKGGLILLINVTL